VFITDTGTSCTYKLVWSKMIGLFLPSRLLFLLLLFLK